MKNLRGEQGSMNVLLVPVILLTLLFIAAAGFAVWAYGGKQDYKNNVQTKIDAAVAENSKAVQATDQKTFAEAYKKPLTNYVGPDAYGSIHISYPKTWSEYVDLSNAGIPLNAYFHEAYVPSVQAKQTYDLRVEVVANPYSTVLKEYASLISLNKVSAVPYSLPKVPTVAGTKLTGQINLSDITSNGTMIVLPMRDKTLQIWTESPNYLPNFNTYILPNLSFSP